MEKKRILLINRGNGNNLGDRAIKASLENLLIDLGCDVTFHDFTEYKPIDKFKNLSSNFERKGRINIKKMVFSLIPNKVKWYLRNRKMFSKNNLDDSFDAVIIGGGQLINDNVEFPFAMYLWTKKFNEKNIPIYLFSVGSMDTFSKLNFYLYKKSFERIKKVYVRDSYSKQVLEEEFGISVGLTYDVAFSINQYAPFKINSQKHEKGSYLIGVTPYKRYAKYNSDKTEHEYDEYWKQYILDKISKGKQVTLFYTTIDDYQYVKKMKDKYNLNVSTAQITDLITLINTINKHDVIISPRMHALILARVYNKQVEPVIISDKIESLKEHYLDNEESLEHITQTLLDDLSKVLD